MVNGQFQCLGNIQHLKNKFGTGYSLVIKTKRDLHQLDLVQKINNFLSMRVRGLKLKGNLNILIKRLLNWLLSSFEQFKEQQEQTIYYQIEIDNNRKPSLSEIFSLIEANKNALYIETYTVSQTTLEDVFLSFARLQRNEEQK